MLRVRYICNSQIHSITLLGIHQIKNPHAIYKVHVVIAATCIAGKLVISCYISGKGDLQNSNIAATFRVTMTYHHCLSMGIISNWYVCSVKHRFSILFAYADEMRLPWMSWKCHKVLDQVFYGTKMGMLWQTTMLSEGLLILGIL